MQVFRVVTRQNDEYIQYKLAVAFVTLSTKSCSNSVEMGGELNSSSEMCTLQCPTCSEHFKEPRILKCLHTFCHGCLEKQKQDEESFVCKCCEQKTNVESARQNSFFVNCMAASFLKEFREGNITCGNCSVGERPLKYCKECMEYLCETCIYCHENTKLTREHHLIPLETFEENLIVHGENRAVFCPSHEDSLVEQYCRSCEETMCRGCEVHEGHNAVSLGEGCSIEVPNLEAIMEKEIAKVRSITYYLIITITLLCRCIQILIL